MQEATDLADFVAAHREAMRGFELTATVTGLGEPLAGVMVRFGVTGSVATSAPGTRYEPRHDAGSSRAIRVSILPPSSPQAARSRAR